MDFKDLFDNPEFSDIAIKLSSGYLLRAHCIVLSRGSEVFKRLLKSRMAEVDNKIITFPEHDNETIRLVIAHLYGWQIEISKLSAETWVNFLRFAHYIEIGSLVAIACGNPPAELTPVQLISLADELDLPGLMCKGFQLFFRKIVDCDEYIEEICSLDWDVYTRMHVQWLSQKFDPCVLLEIDCKYCKNISTGDDAIALLTKFLVYIDISSFTYSQLIDSLQFPIIVDSPLLVHLITGLAKLKPIEGYSKMTSRQEGLILHGVTAKKVPDVVAGNTMLDFTHIPNLRQRPDVTDRRPVGYRLQDVLARDANGVAVGLDHGQGAIAPRDPRLDINQRLVNTTYTDQELDDVLANI